MEIDCHDTCITLESLWKSVRHRYVTQLCLSDVFVECVWIVNCVGKVSRFDCMIYDRVIL